MVKGDWLKENDRNDKGDKSITKNSCKRKSRNFRWRKKRVDTPIINQEQKFEWFRAHPPNNRFSEDVNSRSNERRNNEQSNKSSLNDTSPLVLNSRGIFLKPLITCFQNKVSRNFTENEDDTNAFRFQTTE